MCVSVNRLHPNSRLACLFMMIAPSSMMQFAPMTIGPVMANIVTFG